MTITLTPARASAYVDNFKNMQLRSNARYKPQLDTAVKTIMANKKIYQQCEDATGIPWWWFPPAHYREASLDFNTYFGNGQSLHHRTTMVPSGRGPFKDFVSGVIDAVRIQGFLHVPDWSFAHGAFRWNALNGFGYEGKCNTPYLYAGTTLYGPPEAKGGFFEHDHDFVANALDTRLGCFAILKGMMNADSSIEPVWLTASVSPPDDPHAVGITWVQHALNQLQFARPPLDEDGALGKKTMAAVRLFQQQHQLADDGLPGKNTIEALQIALAALAPAPVAQPPADPMPEPAPAPNKGLGIDIIGFLESLFHPRLS